MSSLPSIKSLAVGFGILAIIYMVAGLFVLVVGVSLLLWGPIAGLVSLLVFYILARLYGSRFFTWALKVITGDFEEDSLA